MTSASSEQERCKARVKARLLGRPELTPRIGRFELLALRGHGGTGLVYEARDTRDGSSVALKLLSHVDARAVARFKREFRAVAELAHDNLVQLHELFADGDQWYFTMELVRGVPFTHYVRRREGERDALDVERLHSALLQLLRAVGFIHAAGRVHCDLKPSNVLVTSEGRVVVLDFSLVSLGSAAAPDTLPAQPHFGTGLRGTPPFVAPELYAGARHSPESDVYALGMMLLQGLNGASGGAREPKGAALHEVDAGRMLAAAGGDAAGYHALSAGMRQAEPAARLSIEQVARLLGSAPATPALRSLQPESVFVGRAQELALLKAAFHDSQHTGPIAVFVSGPSGIGKSALCDRLENALGASAVVLRGRCHEREALPYKAFDGVIDALVQELVTLPSEARRALLPPEAGALLRMFPSLRDAGSSAREEFLEPLAPEPQLQRRAFAELKALLRGLAARKPLVLMVDDLQWADADSAELLLELLGPPNAPALLYIGSHRTEVSSDSEFLRALFEDAGAGRWQCERRAIELGKLEDGDARELAGRLLETARDESQHLLERIVREAGGSPLLLREFALHIASALGALDASLSLSDSFSQRIASLGPSAHSGLMLLALAARPLSMELLTRALAQRGDADAALRALLGTGLVRRGAHAQWVIDHDAHRELALHRVDAAEARALHRELATAYESTRSGEPEWLIEHWRAAGDGARALEYSIAAAHAAAQALAFNRAAKLYETALALLPAHDARRHRLLTELGESSVNAGHSAEAAEAFLAAADSAAPEQAIALRCRAVQQHFRAGETSAGNALLERLMREVGVAYPRGTAGLYLRLAVSRVRLALLRIEPVRRAAATRVAHGNSADVLESVFREIMFVEPLRGALLLSLFHEAAVASQRADRLFVALAWETYGTTSAWGPKVQRRTAKQLARLSELADQLGTPYAAATVQMVRMAAALYEGRLLDVSQPAEAAACIFGSQCRGAFWEESVCEALRYIAVEETGPLTVLCERVPVLLRRARERSDLFADAMLCRTVAMALLAQDQPERAFAFVHERRSALVHDLGKALDLRHWLVVQCLIDCQSYAAQNAAAWQTFEEIWADYERSALARGGLVQIVSHYRRGRVTAALCAEVDDPKLVRIAEQHAKRLLGMRATRAEGPAYSILAALASQRGDWDEARALLLRAENAVLQHGSRVSASVARLQRGRITPGLPGQRLMDEADIALHGYGIRNPERWAKAFIGGVVLRNVSMSGLGRDQQGGQQTARSWCL